MDPVYTLMCAAAIALALRSVYRSVSEAQAEARDIPPLRGEG